MATRVKRTRLPFLTLDEIEKKAIHEFRLLFDQGMRLVEREIERAFPGMDEFDLEGSNIFTKTASIPVQERLIRDYNRRVLHNAPLGPVQLNDDQIKELLLTLDWDGSELSMVNPRFTPASEPTIDETVVALSEVIFHTLNVGEFRKVLQGQKQKVVFAKRTGISQVWIESGAEYVFACRIMFVPAVLGEIRTYDEVNPEQYTKGDEQTITIQKARLYTESLAYNPPSYLEPLIEAARSMSESDFNTAIRFEKSDEEIIVRKEALNRQIELEHLWIELYNSYIEEGMTDREANVAVRDNGKHMAKERVVELRLALAEKVESRWDDYREDLRRRKILSDLYRRQDGIEEEEMPVAAIFIAAEKGKPSKEVDLMGSEFGLSVYLVGDLVEVLDANGKWHKAEVMRTGQGQLKVRRTDGQYRIIEDAVSVRRADQSELALDKDSTIEYNGDMTDIIQSKFGVRIPAGTNSHRIERTLEPVTTSMNSTKLKVNPDTWERNRDAQAKELVRLNAEACEMAGKQFRPNSNKDCIRLLFEEMQLPVQRVLKSGEISCDKETLQALQSMGEPIAGKIIDAREAQSKLSQLEAWEQYAKQGWVQTTWNQYGTPMARYTAEDPNLQNRITAIRETIEPIDGYVFLSNDLGQAEYVTWASLSGDPLLSKAFIDGTDFHRMMIDEVMKAAPDVNLHEEDPRQAGKTINFALLYLMQTFVLSKRLGISFEETQKLVDAYRTRAPVACDYIEEFLNNCQKTGRTHTAFGRIREMPEMRTARGPALHQARKTAWHHHNAGTAAEILKIKQARSWNGLTQAQTADGDFSIALQMHDEVIFMVKDEFLDTAKEVTMEKFMAPIPQFLPFRIDQRVGRNWLQTSK